jgi:hypothetical protein
VVDLVKKVLELLDLKCCELTPPEPLIDPRREDQ